MLEIPSWAGGETLAAVAALEIRAELGETPCPFEEGDGGISCPQPCFAEEFS